MTRTGKIARLPQATREELNRRMASGEQGGSLLRWLNELPAAREVLAALFEGAAITKQNLSEWREGGFGEWKGESKLVQGKIFHRGGAKTRRKCGVGDGARERVDVSYRAGRGESNLIQVKNPSRGHSQVLVRSGKSFVFHESGKDLSCSANRGESNLVKPKIFTAPPAETRDL